MSLFKSFKNLFSKEKSQDNSIDSLVDYFKPLPIDIPKNEIIIPKVDSPEIVKKKEFFNVMPINILIFIKYKDAKGEISERRVTIRHINNRSDGDCDLFSYCHEREDFRTFLLSRVLEITDIKTGETIENPMLFFKGRYGNPEILAYNQVMKDYENEILTMIFIGRADGVLRKMKEK